MKDSGSYVGGIAEISRDLSLGQSSGDDKKKQSSKSKQKPQQSDNETDEEDIEDGISATVRVRRMDYLCSEYELPKIEKPVEQPLQKKKTSGSSYAQVHQLSFKPVDPFEEEDAKLESMPNLNLANLKLINTPSMFDMGCTQADPQADWLTLTMLDRATHKVVKENFTGKKITVKRREDIDKMRQELIAVHSNMLVGKCTIDFRSMAKGRGVTIGRGGLCHLTIDGESVTPHRSVDRNGNSSVYVRRITV